MVSVSVNRVFSIDGGVAIANLSVTASQDIDSEIFKHKVADRGIDFDTYVAVCTPEDLGKLGTTRTGGVSFYRKSTAKVEFSSLTAAFEAKTGMVEELQELLDDYSAIGSSWIGTDDVEITSDS